MVMLAWRHGFRACEVCDLRLSDLNLPSKTIYCRRCKNSNPSLHPMKGDDVRAVSMDCCAWLYSLARFFFHL